MKIPVANIYSQSTARIVAAAKSIYDIKFKNNGEATLAGIFIFIVPILFSLLCYYNFRLMNDRNLFLIGFILGACAIRAVVAMWVVKLSKELNRLSFNWIVLSFLVPGITLVIIGSRKKIKDVNDYKKYLWVPKIKEILCTVVAIPKVKKTLLPDAF